jgi:hypothetical protein
MEQSYEMNQTLIKSFDKAYLATFFFELGQSTNNA